MSMIVQWLYSSPILLPYQWASNVKTRGGRISQCQKTLIGPPWRSNALGLWLIGVRSGCVAFMYVVFMYVAYASFFQERII